MSGSEQDREYLTKHDISRKVTDAITHVLMGQPDDPIRAIADYLYRVNAQQQLDPEAVFKEYDADGNGVLSKDEFSRMADNLLGVMPDEQKQALMEAVDSDKSGTVGLCELIAFLRMWKMPSNKIKVKTALLVIDVQNDFISGTLANSDPTTKGIVPLINQLRDAMDVVVISYDWHPQDHCSFVESANSGATAITGSSGPYEKMTMVKLSGDADRPEHEQLIYARHCVQGTWGSECHKDLTVKPTDGKIYKGLKHNIDSYSAFYDNMKINDCGLRAMLEEQGVTHVFCTGLCFDICVRSTALHGAEAGFQMFVVEDACRCAMRRWPPRRTRATHTLHTTYAPLARSRSVRRSAPAGRCCSRRWSRRRGNSKRPASH